jgi:hypothetical protein
MQEMLQTQPIYQDFSLKLEALIGEMEEFTRQCYKEMADYSQRARSPVFCNLEEQIRRYMEPIEFSIRNLLFKIFLDSFDNGLPLKCETLCETLNVETDDKILPMTVYHAANSRKKLPCIVWIHGGNMFSELVTPPNDRTLFFQCIGRFFASQGVVFAFIEWNADFGKGNIIQQIKDQVNSLQELSYIDSTKMTVFGHSIGGYILSMFIVNDPLYLANAFQNGIVFVAPVVNEAWTGGRFTQFGDLNEECACNFLIPFGQLPESIDNEPIGTYTIRDLLRRKEYASRVLSMMYPFSPTCGISNEELHNKLQGFSQIHIALGTSDTNTHPLTQGGTMAFELKEAGLHNWRIHTYEGGFHSLHLPEPLFKNPPPDLSIVIQMLGDTLAIAKGNPPQGTQDLSRILNGSVEVYSENEKNGMRHFAKNSFFTQVNVNGQLERIPFPKTTYGQYILQATAKKDQRPLLPSP